MFHFVAPVRSSSHVSVYNIQGQPQSRHLVGGAGIEVGEVTAVTSDHLRRILIADSSLKRITRVLPGGSWEYTQRLSNRPTALLAGMDGVLVVGFGDGSVRIYGDKPPEENRASVLAALVGEEYPKYTTEPRQMSVRL